MILSKIKGNNFYKKAISINNKYADAHANLDLPITNQETTKSHQAF